MLGWEFPPIINGGLGVACLGLSEELSKMVDLSIILPKTDPDYILKNVSLIGLNNLDLSNLVALENSPYESFPNVSYTDTSFSPYPNNKLLKREVLASTSADNKVSDNPFQVEDLYGDDILLRVTQYTNYAAALAATMDFDIIHCHDWMTFSAGIRIKQQSGKPLVVHVHSLEYDRSGPRSKNWVFEVEKMAMQEADLIIPVSNYTGSVAKDYYGAAVHKIYPIHNGATPVDVFKQSKDFPEKLVLFLGRVTGQKGPQYFLEIATKVLKDAPNVRFVMAGTGDQLKDLIENGAYKNIGTKFHFTGFLNKEKVHKLLSMTDVYCMPSVSEPFGLSALEAAQFGIPCVISKQSGVSEVLQGALKADYWDVEKMASHIISLLHNNSLREAIIKDAYNDLKSITWQRAALQTHALYQKILA